MRPTAPSDCLLRSSSGLYGKQDVAGGEVGGVQIKDVYRKLPAQLHEACQLRPCAVGDEESVGANVKGRSGAEVATPQACWCARAGSFHPARTPPCTARREDCRVRPRTRSHKRRRRGSASRPVRAPVSRFSASSSSLTMVRPVNAAPDQLGGGLLRPLGLGEGINVLGLGDVIVLKAVVLEAGHPHPTVLAISMASRLLWFQVLSRFCVGTEARKNSSYGFVASANLNRWMSPLGM